MATEETEGGVGWERMHGSLRERERRTVAWVSDDEADKIETSRVCTRTYVYEGQE